MTDVQCPKCAYVFTTKAKGVTTCPKCKASVRFKAQPEKKEDPILQDKYNALLVNYTKLQNNYKKLQKTTNLVDTNIPLISIKRVVLSTLSRCKNSKWTSLEDHANIIIKWLTRQGVDLK